MSMFQAYQPKSGQQIEMAERKTRRVKIKAVVRVIYAALMYADFYDKGVIHFCSSGNGVTSFVPHHSLIETFKITIPYSYESLLSPSSFTWKTPSGSTKMRLDIACNQTDHVEAMFQWYCPLNEYLKVEGLSVEDAVAIEKLVRRKKKPLAPKYISVKDIHLMDPSVRKILQEIVFKGSVGEESIMDEFKTEAILAIELDLNAKIWSMFLVVIQSKVTELSVRDNRRDDS
ncbi:hypothetical protein BGX24_008992 [Mortierella sp. AD032]|nr:hypothetical protein BGX24_008992 [Mortierella sp. AD032]